MSDINDRFANHRSIVPTENDINRSIQRSADRLNEMDGRFQKTAAAVDRAMEHENRETQRARMLHRKLKTDPSMILTEADLGMGVGRNSRQILMEQQRGIQSTAIPASELAILQKYGINIDTSDLGPVAPTPGMLSEEDLSYLHPDERAAILANQRRQRQRPVPAARQPLPNGRQIINDSAPIPPMGQKIMLNERVTPTAKPKMWKAEKYIGETSDGTQIPVWKVINEAAGTSLDRYFRASSVATKVAMLMNETGNANDPRVLQITVAYDKRNQLVKEIRNIEAKGSKNPAVEQQLVKLREALAALDFKLGI